VPGYEGHIWVPRGRNGLKYSTNYGVAYTNVSNVTYCKSIGIGKAKVGANYPTIFIWGTVSGVTGLFSSTDQGATWLRINDDAHQFAGATFLIGDMNVFGRVYMSSGSARGIIYWDLDSPTAIETESVVNETVIYPNPAQDGKFSIMLPVASHRVNVSIYDYQGRLLSEKIFNDSDRLNIDSGLKNGIYFVKVASEGINFTQKLIVQ
jgi:hypothetical protein